MCSDNGRPFLFPYLVALQIQETVSPCRLPLSILGLPGTRVQSLNTSVDVALAVGRGMIFMKKHNNRVS
jgi:hypothetical protein